MMILVRSSHAGRNRFGSLPRRKEKGNYFSEVLT
jgi:hypothetical protein